MTRISGDWRTNPATVAVMTMLTSAGFQAYFVGGCVRNALLGVAVNDVDIATDALPQKVMALAKVAGLNAIPTGIDHGTITVVSDGVPFEITTFRRDIETDGRRAVVAFSTDINDDALRRDFTMNALYADANGNISDPLGGLKDLKARKIRFVDDADARIKEDYLRSLRYFRFHAWYGDPDAGMDAEALAAIAANLQGLDTLSKERVGSEMKKLLSAPDPAPSIGAMAQSGVLMQLLPGADPQYLAPLAHLDAELSADPIRRLAVLGGKDVVDKLRLSRDESRRLNLLRQEIANPEPVAALAYRHGAQAAANIELLRAAIFERPVAANLSADLDRGAAAQFPVKAADLMPDLQGPKLGQRLKSLETRWIESNFRLTKQQLLAV
ncbi:MAG: CCA tRNA nucleotidyltransferase [Paracoccaceae bacterium]